MLCAARGLRLEVRRAPHRARRAVRAVAAGGRAGGHPQHRRRRPDRAVEPGRPRRDGDRPRSPTSGCCSCAATTASATTPTRTCASSTSPPALDALEAAVLAGRRRSEERRMSQRIDERITERYAALSPQERRAAETLLEHLDDLATYRSAELADAGRGVEGDDEPAVPQPRVRRLRRGPRPPARAAVRRRAAPRRRGRRRPGRARSRTRRGDRCGTPSSSPVLADGRRAAGRRPPGAGRRLAQQPPGRAAPAPAARPRPRATSGWPRCPGR